MLVVLGDNLSAPFRQYFTDLAANPSSDIDIIPSSIGIFNHDKPNANQEAFVELLYKAPPELVCSYMNKVKEQPVFFLQSLSGKADAHVMQTLEMASILKEQMNAGKMILVAPYAPYQRQDRDFLANDRICSVAGKDIPRRLFDQGQGVDKIITMELHSKAAEQHYMTAFGKQNVTFIPATDLFAEDATARFGATQDNIVGCAPDGWDKPGDAGQRRALDLVKAYHGVGDLSEEQKAKWLTGLVKKRTSGAEAGTSTTKVSFAFGDVAGKTVLMVDDVGDSMGTILDAATSLKERGAEAVHVYLSFQGGDENSLARLLDHRTEAHHTVDTVTFADAVTGLHDHVGILAARTHSDRRPKYPNLNERVRILPTAPAFERAMKQLTLA